MRTAVRTLTLSAIAALVLSGCMKMEMAFTLHEDDTVDGTVVMAIQKGVGESLGMSDDDLLAELEAEGTFDEVEGGTVEAYDDGEYVGQTITFDGQPLADLDGDDAGFTIVRDGDEYVVGGELEMTEEDTSMLVGASMTLAVTFPGEVTEHNGTLEGSTVTWNLLEQTEPLNARGSASADSSSFPWLWVGIGAAVLALALGVVIGLILVRRRAAAPAAVAVEPGAPTGPAHPEHTSGEAFTPEGADPATPRTPAPQTADTIELSPVDGTGPEEDVQR